MSGEVAIGLVSVSLAVGWTVGLIVGAYRAEGTARKRVAEWLAARGRTWEAEMIGKGEHYRDL